MISATPLFAGVAEENFKQVTLHERLVIRRFFENIIKFHQAGHVILFDTKPVCIATAWLKSPQRQFTDVNWVKGWRAFKKNEHLFPHPNFILNIEIGQEKDGWQAAHLFLINKSSLQKCLQKHVLIFKEVIGEEFSPNWFIEKLEEGEVLPLLIDQNDLLLGILLGYGKESSMAYVEGRKELKTPEWTETYCGVNAKGPKGCKIFPVSFMGNPSSSEVNHLVTQYDSELEEIWSLYHNSKDLLKNVMQKFCESVSP